MLFVVLAFNMDLCLDLCMDLCVVPFCGPPALPMPMGQGGPRESYKASDNEENTSEASIGINGC